MFLPRDTRILKYPRVLRKAEFLVKQQTSFHWCNRGVQLNDDSGIKGLANDIEETLRALQVCLSLLFIVPSSLFVQRYSSMDPKISPDTSRIPITDGHPLRSQCLPRMSGSPRILSFRKKMITLKKSLSISLLQVYFLVLLNLPKFYSSRLSIWARSTDPFSQTCSSRNSTNSISWMILDEQPECDIDFCDRVLTTLLREWKTLRVLASIVFA